MATRKKTTKKPWYQARWTYFASGAVGLFLAYSAAGLAIDTASMFAYAAAAIFTIVSIRALALGVRMS